MNTIGESIRHARVRAGLTGRQVGLIVGARESQISDWETGKKNPGPKFRAAYVRAELLTDAEGHLPYTVDVEPESAA